MFPHRRCILCLVAVSILACSTGLTAQGVKVEVAPMVGVAGSGSDLFEWEGTYCMLPFSCNPVQARGKTKPGLAVGARATLWVNPRFAVEANVVYSQAGVETEQTVLAGKVLPPSSGAFDASARTWMGGIKGLFRLGVGTNVDLLFGGGLGLIKRGGEAYEETLETPLKMWGPGKSTKAGGLLDLGLSVRLKPNLALRIDLEDFIHSTESIPEGTPSQFAVLRGDGTSPLQHDLVLSTGLSVRF